MAVFTREELEEVDSREVDDDTDHFYDDDNMRFVTFGFRTSQLIDRETLPKKLIKVLQSSVKNATRSENVLNRMAELNSQDEMSQIRGLLDIISNFDDSLEISGKDLLSKFGFWHGGNIFGSPLEENILGQSEANYSTSGRSPFARGRSMKEPQSERKHLKDLPTLISALQAERNSATLTSKGTAHRLASNGKTDVAVGKIIIGSLQQLVDNRLDGGQNSQPKDTAKWTYIDGPRGKT